MKRTRRILFIVLVLFCSSPGFSQKKEVIGYFPSWVWKSRENPMTPATIPYHKLTSINYAFFYPLPDGTIVGRDSVGDAMWLRGEPGIETGEHESGMTLVDLAHRDNVRVLLSVGGWADSYNFPHVSSGAETRAQFAHSCVEQVHRYGFDGIDIDWEYPGYLPHNGSPQDEHNFTLLLQAIRDSLSAYGREKPYLLTAALPGSLTGTASMEVGKVAAILDQLNIMTYDFGGPWDSLSCHNAPLFAPTPTDSARNVDAAFKLYHETYGVPAGKLNLGVPFYGHTFSHCTGLYSRHSGADTVHFLNGNSTYADIVARLDKFTRHWDDHAKAPYLVSTDWDMLVSYDDEESVRCKAEYVIDHNAAGLIIWEITGDYLPDRRTPLLDAITSTFQGAH